MNTPARYLLLLTAIVGLLGFCSLLHATESFWSDMPSTREIDRADSLTGFDVTRYVINLRINEVTHVINGNVAAMVTAEENLTSIEYELEGANLSVASVQVNGQMSTFTHQNGIIHIPLNQAQGTQFTTTIVYGGVPSQSPAPYNIGMLFTTNAVYTLSNPDAGRYWWPSYDHPWDKALVDWYITVRSDWLVAANGIRTAMENNGDGTRTHHWVSSYPVATFVMGFAAGPYVEYLQQAGTIPIQNFVLPGQLAHAQTDFANVPEMISYFSDTYGAYPFEKYGHAIVNMSTYAAMEHQTMTTIGAAYVTGDQSYESIVAHELTHQWYGNLVTPITMREVWLKESFATYGEFLWEAHHHGWQAGCDYLASDIQQYYISWENSNGAHTIFNPEYNEMFAPPTYEKSASVLHMLRLKMGNDDFFEFIRALLTTYPNSNINTAEFVALAQQISGQNLAQFFQQWIYSPGIPNANFTVMHNNFGMGRIIAKTTSPTATLFDIDVPISIPGSAVADSLVIRATPGGFINDFLYSAQDDISTIQFDPDHWVLTRSLTQNTMQLTSCMAYNHAVDLTWNVFQGGIDLFGYFVYRRTLPDGVFTRITDAAVQAMSYTDHSVTNGATYQYYVVAVDTENYQSLPSNVMGASPIDFPFDLGFLVVDETRNGTGTNISPTDAMVDDFYSAVMPDFAYTPWDIDFNGTPTLAALSHHPLVLWHCDDFVDMQLINNLSTLGSYVLSGGKLLISGWKYPSQFDAAFLNKFLPGITPVLINSAVLISAQSQVYTELHPDPLKLVAPWNSMLPMSYVFTGATNPLYTAEILDGGTNNGEPLAIRADYTGSLVLLGFPLYFMLQDEVHSFLAQYLPELYPAIVANDDPSLPPLQPVLSVYPNPFRATSDMTISMKHARIQSVEIYNLRGQRVYRASELQPLQKGNVSEVTLSPSALAELGSGIYLVRVITDKGSYQRKTMLVK